MNIVNPETVVFLPGITTRRALTNSSCHALPLFSSVQRLLLARRMARLPSDHVGVGALQYETLRYPGAAEYLAALSAVIDRHRKPFRDLAEALAAKSFLTPTEAATAMPAFEVEVSDQRRDKTQALPVPASFGPRVAFGP